MYLALLLLFVGVLKRSKVWIGTTPGQVLGSSCSHSNATKNLVSSVFSRGFFQLHPGNFHACMYYGQLFSDRGFFIFFQILHSEVSSEWPRSIGTPDISDEKEKKKQENGAMVVLSVARVRPVPIFILSRSIPNHLLLPGASEQSCGTHKGPPLVVPEL